MTSQAIMTAADRDAGAVAAMREFNRFYTNVIGLLRGGHLDSPYSLTEVRVLFELARRDATEVTTLRRALDIDAGYLSRILTRFDADKLISRQRCERDGRRQVISLTGAGQAVFAGLDARQDEQTAGLLAGLSGGDKEKLLAAMAVIRQVLDRSGPPGRPRSYLLRPPRAGDLGWVVQRHGAVYAEEYGWDETFEHLVARIVADFASGHDPELEAAWIAEVAGEPAGCVFCVRQADGTSRGAISRASGTTRHSAREGEIPTAQLRLLLVEPWARGLGIGARLVEECLSFARSAGYQRMTLWTQDCLVDARRIYQRAGFRLAAEGRHHSFGHDLVEQTWTREL
ncbi:MAG TPA: helix-turn-helix domain-containing GNAT family N-acetyltransferase [Streptosporangiaceae bacterium]|nr:helix-turn-helix domain-containing GNAT family N-acetyltransferase [Streptosporangiaceae bacterium]